MTENELEEILRGLNTALKVYHDRRETLSAVEISLKSLLMVLHSKIAEQLQETRQHSKILPEQGDHRFLRTQAL